MAQVGHMRVPDPLKRGDLVAVVAPSSGVPRNELFQGLAWLGGRYRLLARSSLLSRHGYLAGDDSRRTRELAEAMENPDVKAIFAARGGYGAMRIAEDLPWAAFARSPKWIVGFSDITVLHERASGAGVCSLHGPNVTGLFRTSPAERAALTSLLERHEAPAWTGLEIVHAGSSEAVSGLVAGGNLAMLYALGASGARLVPEGSVLFLEDVTERPYRIDRILTALRSSGALGRASAVVLGEMTECEPGPDGVTADEVLRERTAGLGVLVVRGAPFGHGSRNSPLPLGFSARITRVGDRASLTFAPPTS